jgi:ATP-binding cassette, subfamily B, bacterial CvaB/MchF/RaxB
MRSRRTYTRVDNALDHAYAETAAKSMHIHNVVVAMPMGCQTLADGVGVSLFKQRLSGQKQRILLIRAHNKQLGVLDEAASALVIDNERRANAAVKACTRTTSRFHDAPIIPNLTL